MASSNRKRNPSLTQNLVSEITGSIQSGGFVPGDKLPTESVLMQQYGVSRTVVREAISKLQASGMVETRHGIGTFVLRTSERKITIDPATITTLEDVIAVLELRISLEVEAAALAAERRSEMQLKELKIALDNMLSGQNSDKDDVESDFEFHQCITRAAGNRYFTEILEHLGKSIIPRTRLKCANFSGDDLRNYLTRVNMEHEDIYLAIARQDAAAARAAMRMHLTNSKERHRALYAEAKESLQE
ncbi:FadR/GntR family transcriptional regulator [Halioxenophilus aromaticivorans]|uniref:FadR/GntR family transcriptional regulator n=1 Tax=Halioxenophilus aromaticivorans TaxID=1306992 RepID=A0AAV3U5U1_9ALTE